MEKNPKKQSGSSDSEDLTLRRYILRRIIKISLWTGIPLAVIAGVVVLSVYIGVYGGRELFLKGCFNFRYDLFSIQLPQHQPDRLVFAAVGDTAVYTPEHLPAKQVIAQSLMRVCKEKNCDFGVLLGDNISENGIKSAPDTDAKAYHDDIFAGSDLPFLVIAGNHDYRNNLYAQIAHSYVNKNWIMPNNEFAVRTELADFFGINSNCDVISYMKLERRPFRPEKWNFVFAHHSLYSTGPHGDAAWHIRSYWERYLAERTDFHVSGHNHISEYLTQDRQKTQYIVSGAGSAAYTPDTLPAKSVSAADVIYNHQNGSFTIFTVTKDSVETEIFGADGNSLYKNMKERDK